MKSLEVKMVWLYPDQIAKEHHSDKYFFDWVTAKTPSEPPTLRRGERFFMTIRFNRTIDITQDVVTVKFNLLCGSKMKPTEGTKQILTVCQDIKHDIFPDDPLRWGIILERQLGTDIMVSIRVPLKAPAGFWKCTFRTYTPGIVKHCHDYLIKLLNEDKRKTLWNKLLKNKAKINNVFHAGWSNLGKVFNIPIGSNVNNDGGLPSGTSVLQTTG